MALETELWSRWWGNLKTPISVEKIKVLFDLGPEGEEHHDAHEFWNKIIFIEIQGHRLMPNTIFASKSSRQGIFRKANGPFGLGLLEA